MTNLFPFGIVAPRYLKWEISPNELFKYSYITICFRFWLGVLLIQILLTDQINLFADQ
jgi:hypothetical protein